jgi:hypothetical protein
MKMSAWRVCRGAHAVLNFPSSQPAGDGAVEAAPHYARVTENRSVRDLHLLGVQKYEDSRSKTRKTSGRHRKVKGGALAGKEAELEGNRAPGALIKSAAGHEEDKRMDATSSDKLGDEDLDEEGGAVPLRHTRGLSRDVAEAIRSAMNRTLCATEVQAIFGSNISCGLPVSTAAPEDPHGELFVRHWANCSCS